MSLCILDTDPFPLYQHTHPVVTANIARHVSDRLIVSVVSVGELAAGRQHAIVKARTNDLRADASHRLAELFQDLAGWPVLPMTEPALDRFDAVLKSRRNVGANDQGPSARRPPPNPKLLSAL